MRPEDLDGWIGANARADAPAPVASVGPEQVFTTRDGWPATRRRVRFTNHDEDRIVCVYRFLHTIAAVIVRGRNADALVAHAAEIDDVLAGVKPDFRRVEPAALGELWDL